MKKTISFLLVTVLLCGGLLSGCAKKTVAKVLPDSIDEYNSAEYTIAVEAGAVTDEAIRERLPNATYINVNDAAGGYLAVQTGQADAFAGDSSMFDCALRGGLSGLTSFSEKIGETEHTAVGISLATKLDGAKELINSFIAEIRERGILDDMFDRWVYQADYDMPDIEVPSAPDKTIKIGTTGLAEPYTFYKDNALTGYDIEMIYRFALYANAKVEISVYDWGGIIPAAVSGNVDYIMSDLFVTEERSDIIGFSDSCRDVMTVLVVPGKAEGTPKYSSLSDFDGAVIGSQTGTVFEGIIAGAIPNTTHRLYEDIGGQILALRNHDVDALGLDEPVAKLAASRNADLAVFPAIVQTDTYGMPMQKNGELTAAVSALIGQYEKDGTLDTLKKKWFSGDEKQMKIDMSLYTGYDAPNGVLRFIHDSTQMPMSYINDAGNSAGYEVELVLMIGRALGRRVEITRANFSALITSVTTGAADIASGCVSITEERRESVDFPASHYEGGIVLLCRRADVVSAGAADGTVKTLSDLDGKRWGVLIGSIFDEMTTANVEKPILSYYNSNSDLVQALNSNKIDAFLVDLPVAVSINASNSNISYLPELLSAADYAYIFPKTAPGDALRAQINDFLADAEKNGMLKELSDIWLGNDESRKTVISPSSLGGGNGTLRFATCSTLEPFSYVSNGAFVGYDIDFITRFCREYDYNLEITDMDPGAIIAAVGTEKYNFGGCSITITEERKESVNFSSPNYHGGVVAAVRTSDMTAQNGGGNDFFTSVIRSFERTFITEDRWKLVLDGLIVTLIISIASMIVGTVFGFGFCALRRSKNSFASRVTAAVIRFIQSIPLVVLLMVLYYVVFASSGIDGIIVAVIGFAINFGVNSAEIMRTGIDAVERGQWEAASALGFPKAKTFVKIVMPQAIQCFLPSYKGEFISMMKMTSVVGYIAIQDLTKASEIIRSRTYEAFFPLIAIALIYFFLAWGLTALIGLVEVKIDPKKRDGTIDNIRHGDARGGAATVPAAFEGDEVIRIEHLKKAYPNVTPLADVNAVVRRGEVVSVIGPSGTGKSTLLRMINRLENPSDGKVFLLGRDMDVKKNRTELRGRVGMVFQSYNLFPHLTVVENVMLAPVELLGKSRADAYDEAIKLLSEVGLAEKTLSYPDELSGGQKQRAAIARTLAMKPEVILFDEPTSALDPAMISEVLGVISALTRQGLTMMIVTHEMRLAREVATRVFYMDEGEIYEDGTPKQIFEKPVRERTRSFIFRVKAWEYAIHSTDFDFYEMNGSLEEFCLRQFLPKERINRVLLVVEELVMQGLLPAYKDGAPDIIIHLDCGEEGHGVRLSLTYERLDADSLSPRDELSQKLLDEYVEEITEARSDTHAEYRFR